MKHEKNKNQNSTKANTISRLKSFAKSASYRRLVRMTSFSTRFIIIAVFLVATALAQIQSHSLSEIMRIDQDLNMNTYNINASYINATNDVCITGGVCLSSGSGTWYNKTSVTCDADFSGCTGAGGATGYQAGDAVCNSEFSGTHLCSIGEIQRTIATKTLASLTGWSGEAWIATGPAKYSPASLPVNDCNGFTHGSAGSYLGNWWSFSTTTGGVGKTGHCGNTLSLGCCI